MQERVEAPGGRPRQTDETPAKVSSAHLEAGGAGWSAPPRVPRPGLSARDVLRLQRSVGNAAVQRYVTGVVQRQHVQMRSGHSVGDQTGTTNNIREDVLQAMDRLHMLWSLGNGEYDREYPAVARRPAGSSIADPASEIPLTLAALRQNEQPTLAPAVAARFLNVVLSDGVGTGLANTAADVGALQDALRDHGHLSASDHAREHAMAAAGTPFASLTATAAAIVAFKTAVVAGQYGWAPVHADEAEDGGDKFADQTFDCGMYSVFIPHGVGAQNRVHVFFSPGGVTGSSGLNAVLEHGLRGASDASNWILVAVPGKEPGFNTIGRGDIDACLARAGRPSGLEALRLSAHSRGYRGLRETVAHGMLPVGLVERVVIFDANYGDIARTLARSGIPPSRVTAYDVGTGRLGLAGSRTVSLASIAGSLRSIGYIRLIQDAATTHPGLTVPPVITSQLFALPPRGAFSTSSPPPPSKVNIVEFCKTHRPEISTILRQEARRPEGLMRFMEDNDLAGFGGTFTPGIYSHHFFVSELGHEVTD